MAFGMRGGGGGRGMGPRRLARAGADGKSSHPLTALRRVWPWLAPFKVMIIIGAACMVASSFLSQQPPRLVQHLLDTVLGDHRYDLLAHTILLFALIYAGQHLANFIRTYILHVAGQKLLHILRVRVYEHFQRLSLTYFDNRQTGDLMSRVTNDVEQTQYLVEHGLDAFFVSLLTMGIAFSYMWHYEPRLALLAVAPVPVLAVSFLFFSRMIHQIYRKVRDEVGELMAKLQDNLAGIRVIKAFSREQHEYDEVTRQSQQVLDINIQAIRRWSGFWPLMQFIGSSGALAVLWYGAHLVSRGELQLGELVAINMYLLYFYAPIGTLSTFFDGIQRSLAASERIFDVLDTDPDITDPATPTPLSAVRGEVEFRHVTFQYASGDEVLKNVSITARPGERVALVGRSGAGKTSFVNLIPRFYEVVAGQLLVDGVDVRQVRQADLRRHIAVVLQETFLFNGTVRENLRYGKQDATDDELIAAAQAANAYEYIEHLPQGFDTEIGERGVKLSGGQKQRLAIARAVLADPRILILDEATSSVDSESEFLIHQALDRLMTGRTTFIIAHRLSTVRNADIILVLEGGEIVERGTHDELLTAAGVYAQMYRQQYWLEAWYEGEADELLEVQE